MPRRPIVFVSHSRKDRRLVAAIGRELRAANVTPVFYSDFTSSSAASNSIPAAVEIAELINKSCAVFILLGKNVAKYPHTQAWVAFESGIAYLRGKRLRNRDPYRIGFTFLVEDISQRCSAALPHVDYAYLFDFGKGTHWKGVELFARLRSYSFRPRKARNKLPLSLPDEHEFRLKSFSCKFKCPWEDCRTEYELWVYKGNLKTALEPPSSMRCSVCRKEVSCSRSLEGKISFSKGIAPRHVV